MDDAATLSEVLILLDSIDSNESDVSSSGASPLESDDAFDSTPATPQHASPLPAPKTTKEKKDRRRKEGPVVYSTDLQRRKKAELRTLRTEAQLLTAQLQRLLQSRFYRIATPVIGLESGQNTGHGSGWHALAIIESEKHERAERTNRELKAIMERQRKVQSSLRKVLEKSKATEWMDLFFEPQPTSDRPLYQFDFSEAILAELSGSLERLRLQTNTMFSAVGDDISISCNTRSKPDNRGGVSYIKTTSITPVACAVQKAGEILWHHITTKKNMDIDKSFRFIRTRDPRSLERNCLAALPHGTGEVLNLDGVNVVRKYEEENQIVLVGTTSWFLPTGGLQFEDHHWTVISPSPVDSLHASVVQSCYQLQVKHVDTAAVMRADLDHTREVVFSSISKKLRNVLQLQQNVLLDKVNPMGG